LRAVVIGRAAEDGADGAGAEGEGAIARAVAAAVAGDGAMRTVAEGTTLDGLAPSSAVRPTGRGVMVTLKFSPEISGADHSLPSR
jgi:hypothetical protein